MATRLRLWHFELRTSLNQLLTEIEGGKSQSANTDTDDVEEDEDDDDVDE